jgi:hypothetical protein
MRLPRIDRVDAPLHLAARTQDWLGQAAFDQFLAVRAGHETQAELVPLRLRTGGTGSSPERAEARQPRGRTCAKHPPPLRLRDHRAGPGGVVRIALQHPVPYLCWVRPGLVEAVAFCPCQQGLQRVGGVIDALVQVAELSKARGHCSDGELAWVDVVDLVPGDGVDTVASGTPRTEYALAIVWSRAFWL